MQRSSTMSHHRRAAGGSPPALRLLAAAACAASLAAGVVHAQTTYEVLGGSFVEESGGVAADVVIVAGADGEDRSTLVTTSVLANELHVYDRGYLDAVSVGGVVDFLTVGSGGGINTSSLSATNLSITGSDSSVVVSGSATVYSTLTLSGGGSLAVAGGLTVGGSGLAEIQVSQGSALVTGTLDSIQGIIDVRDGGSVTLGGAATLGGGPGPALRISSTTGSPAVFTANAPVSFAGGATSLDLGAGGLLVVNANVAAGSIGNVSGNSAVTINSGTFALGTAGGAAGFSTLSFGDANPLTLAGGRLEVGRLAFSGSGAVVRTGGTIASGSLSVANGAVTLAAGDFVGGSPDGYGGGDVVTVGGGGVLTVQGSIDASNSMSPGNITVSEGGRLVIDGGSITAVNTSGAGGYGTLSVSGSNGIAVTNGGTYDVDDLVLDQGASLPAGTVRQLISLDNGATITSTSAFSLQKPGSLELLSISTGTGGGTGIIAPRFSISGPASGTVMIGDRYVSTASDSSGSLALTVSSGTLALGGGGQTISSLGGNGVLEINGDVTSNSLSSFGGTLVVNANVDATSATLGGNTSVTLNSGTLSLPVNTGFSSPFSFSTASPLTLNGGRIAGGALAFSGSAALVRTGGTLAVGALSVSSGSMTLAAGDTVGGGDYIGSSDAVTVGSGGVLTVQGSINTAGSGGLPSVGSVTVAAGGRLILAGGNISALSSETMGGAQGALALSGSNAFSRTGGNYAVDVLTLAGASATYVGGDTIREAISVGDGSLLTTTTVLEILGRNPGSNLNIPASVSIASGGELRLTDFSGSVTVGMYANFPEVSSGTSIRYALGVAGNLASDLEAMLADGRITYTNAGGTVGVYYEPSLSPGYQGTTYVGYVTAVPEPSTLALASLGIACAWRVTRQSRRRPDGRVPAHDSPR